MESNSSGIRKMGRSNVSRSFHATQEHSSEENKEKSRRQLREVTSHLSFFILLFFSKEKKR
ncbi:hypothetical protein OIU84_010838 [Salix udensis]|uniref:Uncharacterized protein n=1 Tax=Salix udensis TaxID=889485 RepID=A0AAD6JNN2_9ROSI|nr:hypothetical protein OIU84_010838 [Salix udensis]